VSGDTGHRVSRNYRVGYEQVEGGDPRWDLTAMVEDGELIGLNVVRMIALQRNQGGAWL
jgi:hypothetical protein